MHSGSFEFQVEQTNSGTNGSMPRRICGGKSVKNQQWHLHKSTGYQDSLAFYEMNQNDMGMGQNPIPLVNIKIAGIYGCSSH